MKTHVTLQVALTEAEISQNLPISIFLGTVSNISLQKNARTPEQNISLRNICKKETAILDMQMSKLPMISGYGLSAPSLPFYFHYPRPITLLFSTN